MTTLSDELHDVHPGRPGPGVGIALGRHGSRRCCMRFFTSRGPTPLEAVLFGIAIVGAGVPALMGSRGRAARHLGRSCDRRARLHRRAPRVRRGHGVRLEGRERGRAVRRLVPSPPGAAGEDACSLALANMTGANRLLIGIGWSLVGRSSRCIGRVGGPRAGISEVRLERSHAVEVSFLALATVYSLTLPLKGAITLVDAAILVSIFVAYTWRITRAPGRGTAPRRSGPAHRDVPDLATTGGGRRSCSCSPRR